jgi:FKBP-type peptidyl-prolyl cis-trans isomerase FkpA
VRSVVLSYRAPEAPSGPATATAIRGETALAAGLVAGLALGALITAGVYDAFPGGSSRTAQTTPTPHAGDLEWTDVKFGSGTAATAGKLVTVQYTLWLADGTRIDSSAERGNQFKFTLGKGEVIMGFDEGVLGMRVGGIRWLTIPPALAYGAAGAIATPGPSIPPDATLVFEVELLAVGP